MQGSYVLRRQHPLLLPGVSIPVADVVDDQSSFTSSTSQLSTSGASVSSSDGPMSPHQRDAQLTLSRTSQEMFKPRPYRSNDHLTDDDMSSDDDGDDGETTSHDSDHDPHDLMSHGTLTSSLPWGYRNVLKRYQSSQSSDSAPSTFILETSNYHLGDIRVVGDDSQHPSPHFKGASSDEDVSSSGVTLIRIQSRRTNEFLFTPLVAHAVRDVIEAQASISVSLEQQLDEIIKTFLSSYPNPSPESANVLIIEARLALWRIITWQTIQSLSTINNPRSGGSVLQAHALDTASFIVFQMSGGICEGRRSSDGIFSISAAINSARMTIGTLNADSPALVECGNVQIYPSSIAIRRTALDTTVSPSLGDLRILAGDGSPYVATRVAAIYMEIAPDVVGILKSHRKRQNASRRALVQTLLARQTNTSNIADPMSWTQVSFMVKSGLPKTVRSDLSFPVLASLRNNTRLLSQTETEQTQKALQDSSPAAKLDVYEDIIRLLKTCSRDGFLDTDRHDIADLRLVRQLFPSIVSADLSPIPGRLPSKPLLSHYMVEIRTGRLVFELGDPNASGGDLRIGPMLIAFRHGTRHLHPSMSTHSLSSATGAGIGQVLVNGTVEQVRLSVLPSSLLFARNLLRQTRGIDRNSKVSAPSALPARGVRRPIFVEIFLDLRQFEVVASAQKLNFGASLSGIRTVTTFAIRPEPSGSESNFQPSFFGAYDEFNLQARSAEESAPKDHERAILAGISTTGAAIYVASGDSRLRCTASLKTAKLSVPRSAIKLYRFIEEWKAEYLPTYDAMFRGLLSEIGEPSDLPAESQANIKSMDIDFQATIQLASVSLHIMHGTWLSWAVYEVMSFTRTPDMQALSFGCQLARQTITLSAQPDGSGAITSTSDSSVKLELPSLRISGAYEEKSLRATLVVEKFKLMLKPQYVDDILAVQQKFGNDFNDILDLLAETRTRGSPKANPTPRSKPNSLALFLSASLKGFTIGIRGPTSIQYLESSIIRGNLRKTEISSTTWRLEISNLSLSLVHHASFAPRILLDQARPSANMVMDCIIHNDAPPATSNQDEMQHLVIQVQKIHALMMSAAIGELGDLVDHIQAEMLQRKEQRALELEEIKKENPASHENIRGYSSSCWGKTSVQQPNHFREHQQHWHCVPPFSGKKRCRAKVEVTTRADRAGDTGFPPLGKISWILHAKIRDEQCKDAKFRISVCSQTIPEHFQSASHDALNRMLYPEMSAEVHSRTSGNSRRIWIRATVSGFELDVSPSLAGYIFSIIDVYRIGKEHFDRFTPQGRGDTSQPLTPDLSSPSASGSANYSAIPTSDIRMSLIFRSGKVRFHGPEDNRPIPPSTTIPDYTLPDLSRIIPEDSDVFNLPMVSTSLEYHATPASHKTQSASQENQPSSLMLNLIIHSSENTIHPTLLPFITELTRQVEDRLAHASPITKVQPRARIPQSDTEGVMDTMEISISLRIDQSRLDLTCLPDVNVVSSLHWQSGGFVARISPGAHKIGLVGTIEGITASMRHGYLVEDCANASARDLTFTLAFSTIENDDGQLINAVSLVVNTQLEAVVRFSRLQDIMCFKAVWLDRIAVFEGMAKGPPSPTTTTTTASLDLDPSSRARKGFLTTILIQIDPIRLEVDLGQAITKLTLNLHPVIIRTRLTDALSEISFSSDQVRLQATRALSGTITLPNLTFETVRRRKNVGVTHARLRELNIRSGELDMSVDFEGKKILLLRGDPFEVTAYDDWTKASSAFVREDRQVQLHFIVKGGQLRASARIMTIPELILTGGKVATLIRAQRDGAARESKAFRSTRLPKPNNPLSTVATAMLQFARSKLKAEETTDFIVNQHMHLHVAQIRLTIFNQADTRMTQFEALGVHGNLIRNVKSDSKPPYRDLNLALESFEVRGGDMPAQDRWLDFHPGAKVFTMPEMQISMQSTEFASSNRLEYVFSSTFPQPKAKSGYQTLYIALDFHKYEQLMAMQSTFKTEIEKALAEVAQRDKSSASKNAMILSTTSGATDPTSSRISTLPAVVIVGPDDTSEAPSPTVRTDIIVPPDITTTKVGIRGLTYHCIRRVIDTPKLHQLGAASPDLETFKQWTNISIRDSLPVWIHEYATVPIEQLMKVLLEVYIKQLKAGRTGSGGEIEQDA